MFKEYARNEVSRLECCLGLGPLAFVLGAVGLGVGVGLVVEVLVGNNCVDYSLGLVLEVVVGVGVEIREVAKVRVDNSDANQSVLS